MRSNLKEARQTAADITREIELLTKERGTIGAEAVRGKRPMSDAEREKWLGLGERITIAEGKKAENAAILRDAEARNEAERAGTVVHDPDSEAARRSAARGGVHFGGDDASRSAIGRPSGRRFVEMFGQIISSDGWESANEFLATLHSQQSDPRLRASFAPRIGASATGTVGADGGFSVPTEFAAEWLDLSLESEIVRPRATIWPMTSDTRHVPAFDMSDSSSGTLFGAFSGGWVGQGDEITPQTPKMRAVEMRAGKLALLTEVANELIADGVGFDQQLGQAIVKAIGWFLDVAFLSGIGGPAPLGVLNSAALVTVPKESGQAAKTITYTNLTSMFARLAPASLPGSVWVANSTTIPQLSSLTISVGTGGSFIPAMTTQDGQFMILTRPVVFTEKVPVLGTKGDIMLCDFSQYAVGLRADMALERSAHIGFTRDTTYYRGLLRAGGQPTWNGPYTPLHGDTQSPFVALASR